LPLHRRGRDREDQQDKERKKTTPPEESGPEQIQVEGLNQRMTVQNT